MKKRVLLLLPLFLGACSDSGESPVIKIEKLYAKVESEDESSGSGEKDYANQRDELPALKVGDEVKALLLLDGNGAELKTFRLQNDDEVDTKLIFEKTEVSTEGNLTDVEKGQLRFKDGVSKASMSQRSGAPDPACKDIINLLCISEYGYVLNVIWICLSGFSSFHLSTI